MRLVILCVFFALNAYADDAPVCKKCQVIREYNAAHPENNYYWYDDYLEEKGLDKNGEKKEGEKKEKALFSDCKSCKKRKKGHNTILADCESCKKRTRGSSPLAGCKTCEKEEKYNPRDLLLAGCKTCKDKKHRG
jgi:hypothetical protein